MNTQLELSAPAQLTEPQSQAWLSMAQAKNQLVFDLTRAELAAQQIFNDLKSNDHAALDEALAAYRKAHSEMVELRKSFTSKIDAGIVQPLMAFEKRVDPKNYEIYKNIEAASLQLRKQAAAEAEKANYVNQELAAFKAHCVNEFFRIAAEYRSLIRKEISNQYATWLREKITPDTDKIKIALGMIDVPPVEKFMPRVITADQMQAVYDTVPKPRWKDIYLDMMNEVDSTFAHFSSDLANAEAAIEEQDRQSKLSEIEEQQKLKEETAINTLITTAEAVTVDAPRIKRILQVEVIESERWAKAVMAGFITNLPSLSKYIRSKSWAEIKIGQMATYLGKLATDEGVIVNGLNYQEVEK